MAAVAECSVICSGARENNSTCRAEKSPFPSYGRQHTSGCQSQNDFRLFWGNKSRRRAIVRHRDYFYLRREKMPHRFRKVAIRVPTRRIPGGIT
jgi:hypothetical protein